MCAIGISFEWCLKSVTGSAAKAAHNMAGMDIDMTRRNKKARLLTDSERDKLDEFIESIHYSSRYEIMTLRECHCFLVPSMLTRVS